MDYIIFGTGTGASLVLSGWLLREMGPRLRDRSPGPDDVFSASELVQRMGWARFCAACGMALLTCGLTVLIVTGITIFLAPDDETGGLALIVALGLCGVMMLMWTALYLRQFGSVGILRPKPKVETPPTVEAPATAAGPASTGTVQPSFEQAASSPGGFGRFAGFLRREPASEAAPVAAEPSDEPESVTTTPPVETAVGTTTPPAQTAAVATTHPAGLGPTEMEAPPAAEPAAVAGIDRGDEKRLTLDDPLVTSVPLPSRQHVAGDGPDQPAGPGEGTANGADTALTLRERRLRRQADDPDAS